MRPANSHVAHAWTPFRSLYRKLPAALREQYGQFVIRSCAGAAKASGGWLWFGNKVSKAEQRVLERIAAALELEG